MRSAWRLVALALAPMALAAQQNVEASGAIELLLPLGARTVALGQAATADQSGSEGVWWNPASLARSTQREVGLHYAQSFTDPSDAAFGIVLPISQVGTTTLAGRLFSLGEQPAVSREGVEIGTIYLRTIILAASFSAPFGDHFNAGLSYKLYQRRSDCSGDCIQATTEPPATTSALDFGAQYSLAPRVPLVLGASITNLGLPLQVHDQPQADALPKRLSVGVAYSPRFAQLDTGAQVKLLADLVTRLSGGGVPGLRLGADLGWQRRYHLRAGYALYAPLIDGSGLTLGVGATSGSLVLDIARVMSGSNPGGQPPTYLSMRYLF